MSAAAIRIDGSSDQIAGLGGGMTGGELTVAGGAGAGTGAGMRGGTLHVHGSVGDDAGQAMSGGLLRVDADAGDRLGANAPGAAKGMTGGEIIVSGSAGVEAGARMRRGLIVVAGNADRDAGRAMIAGSLVCWYLRRWSRPRQQARLDRGLRWCDLPPTYRSLFCLSTAPRQLTWRYLIRHFGMMIDDTFIESAFRRYCGDAGDPGKGEILERA